MISWNGGDFQFVHDGAFLVENVDGMRLVGSNVENKSLTFVD